MSEARHFVIGQSNEPSLQGVAVSASYETELQACDMFQRMMANPKVNWVKRYTIRADGKYLFQEEYQRRTIQ